MPIPAMCSACGHRFQAPDSFAGKRVKCKHCGDIFQVPAAAEEAITDEDAQLDALAQLESQPGATGIRDTHAPGRTGAGQRATVARTAQAPPGHGGPDEETVDSPAQQFARPNLLTYTYPGARLVDQWLSTVLVLASLAWLVMVESSDTRDNPGGIVWIKAVRLLVPLLLYVVAIYPITLMLVRRAAKAQRFRLPPAPQFRVFAAYLPALTLAVVLWTVGEGAIGDLIIGVCFGLILSSAFLWLLYRLKENEIPLTVGYGAGGFAIGALITVAVVFTANTAARLAVARDPTHTYVPASPLGPLAWVPPPAPAPEPIKIHPRTPSADVPITVAQSTPGPASQAAPPAPPLTGAALLSSLQADPIPGPLNNILQPLSAAPFLAMLQPSTGVDTITDWNLASGQALPAAVKLAGQLGTPVLSPDGKSLASIATFPRRSVWVTSFETGKILSKTDLDPNLNSPSLIGFVDADHVMVRGSANGTVVDLLTLGKAGQSQRIKLPPLEDRGTTLTIDTANQRLGLATKIDGVPTFMQYSLTDPTATPAAFSINIDHSLPVSPLGMAYGADGKRVGLLFEQQGNVALLFYDAATGSNPTEWDYPAPAGIPGVSYEEFKGNGLLSVDATVWVVEGQVAINANTGDVITPLGVDHVVSARMLTDDRLALLTAGGGGEHVTIATFDPAKLQHLVQATSQPTTSPSGG